MRGPGRCKVRQRDTADHRHPGQRTRDCRRTLLLAFAHQDSGLKAVSPLGWGWVSQEPLHPSRGLLFRDAPSPPSQPGARAPSCRPFSPAPFYISSASSRGVGWGGKVWEQKLAYALGIPLPLPPLLVTPFLGREPAAWRGLGSKRVSQLCLAHPPAPSPVTPSI